MTVNILPFFVRYSITIIRFSRYYKLRKHRECEKQQEGEEIGKAETKSNHKKARPEQDSACWDPDSYVRSLQSGSWR